MVVFEASSDTSDAKGYEEQVGQSVDYLSRVDGGIIILG